MDKPFAITRVDWDARMMFVEIVPNPMLWPVGQPFPDDGILLFLPYPSRETRLLLMKSVGYTTKENLFGLYRKLKGIAVSKSILSIYHDSPQNN